MRKDTPSQNVHKNIFPKTFIFINFKSFSFRYFAKRNEKIMSGEILFTVKKTIS